MVMLTQHVSVKAIVGNENCAYLSGVSINGTEGENKRKEKKKKQS